MRIALALVALSCTSCFVAKLFGKGDGPQEVTLGVSCPPAVNEGRPFYFVVRTVDTKSYLTETYDDVAAKVMTPDATVLASVVLIPGGQNTQVHVEVPQKTSIAAAFLFTTPSGSWQTRFDAPLPGKIDIALQNGSILTVNPPSAAR
ncbi:MAG TPA: hypothetical protein VGH20_06445 [Myxococcales bacterium]